MVVNVSAEDSDSEYYDYAVKLRMVDLFRGTDIGFELEREPTRLEGAVMFVRLLGAEEEALEMDYYHPFSDVPQWGSPYVGYLYKNELTNGISADEFGSYMPIKAISYMTFALRALSYSDEGTYKDFEWQGALEFAYTTGIIDSKLYLELKNRTFLRGHVAWTSFEILTAETKSVGTTLIDKLIFNGAVKRDTAEAIGLIQPVELSETQILIGHTFDYALSELGVWDRNQFSRYGFDWFIYDSDYQNYIQIGTEGAGNDIVTGILGASNGFAYEKNISVGMSRSDLEAAYTESPLTELRKPLPGENTIMIYTLDNNHKSTYRTSGGDYITYYFDSYESDKITAILVIDDMVEDRTIDAFPLDADDLFYKSLEIQVFCLTNAFRVQKGLAPVIWDQDTEKAASLHSRDMAENDYFSHTSQDGSGLGDRLDSQNISFTSAGENIAAGYRDPVHMINAWLNSTTGHRETLLGNYDYLGVGIWIDVENYMYGTQDYWK